MVENQLASEVTARGTQFDDRDTTEVGFDNVPTIAHLTNVGHDRTRETVVAWVETPLETGELTDHSGHLFIHRLVSEQGREIGVMGSGICRIAQDMSLSLGNLT